MSSELLRSAPTVLWHRVSSTAIATNERKSLCLCHRHSPVADYSSCKCTTHHDNRSNSNSQCHIYCPLSFPYLLLLRIHCFFFFNKTLLRGCIVSRRQEISSFVIQSLFAYPAVRYDIYWCVRASLDPDAKQKKKSWCCYSPASGSNESHYMTFSRRKSAQEYRIWKTDRISNGNERRLDGLHARIELSWFIHPHRWSIKRW